MYANLATGKIELGSVGAGVEGLVYSNMFETNKILAIINTVRKHNGDSILACDYRNVTSLVERFKGQT